MNIDIDRNKDYRDTPPYESYDGFKSVFDGVAIEINIVEHCNLNCAGCDHFAQLAEPFFIDLEILKDELVILKSQIPTIRAIRLIGGEPLLHPQLLEICKMVRTIFPDSDYTQISIMTNGVLLKNVLPYVNELKENNIGIGVTTYPGKTDMEVFNQLEKDGIVNGIGSRLLMSQFLIDVNGQQDKNKQFFRCHHSIPVFILQDYKIYICPFSALHRHFDKKYNINIPEDKNDYLDIRNISLEQLHMFCFTPKEICKYCMSTKDENGWMCHQTINNSDEYLKPFNEWYFSNYENYLSFIDNKKFFDELINPIKNTNKLDFRYKTSIVNEYFIQYGYGKIDIIIPYRILSKYQIQQLYNTLNNQTIIKECCVYLISDESPCEKQVKEYFNYAPFSVKFLKTNRRSGPGIARNLGFDHSYNKYVIFFDSDDYFIDNNSLELLYNYINSNNLNVVEYYMITDLNNLNEPVAENYIYNRNFLVKNNIKFNNLYYGEDKLFFDDCRYSLNDNIPTIEPKNILAVYGEKNNIYNTSNQINDGMFLYIITIMIELLIAYNLNNQKEVKRYISDLYLAITKEILILSQGKMINEKNIQNYELKIILYYYFLYLSFNLYDYDINYINQMINQSNGQKVSDNIYFIKLIELWLEDFKMNKINIKTLHFKITTIEDLNYIVDIYLSLFSNQLIETTSIIFFKEQLKKVDFCK